MARGLRIRPLRRRVGLRALATLGALAAVAVVLAPSGGAKPPASEIKRYDACIQNDDTGSPACNTSGQPSTLPGGTTAHLKLTVANELASNQSLGSVNLTAPVALPIDPGSVQFSSGSGTFGTNTAGQIQLRDLNLVPGSSVSVSFNVTTPCSGSGFNWQIAAKQSNRFAGTGNDFLLISSTGFTSNIAAGACHLAFVTQPANAQVNSVITDTAYNPTVTGDPGSPQYVAVGAFDGSGHQIASATGTVTLSKVAGTGGSFASVDATASFNNGVATFPTLRSSATGDDLQLKAQASGFTDSDPSSPFDITTGGADCQDQPVCSFSTPLTNSRVDTTATGNFDFVAIDDAPTVPASVTATGGGCEHFIGTGTGFEETDSRNGDGTLDFTYYITDRALKRAYGPNYGQPNVPLCAGGKVVVNNHPVDCDPLTQTPWTGRHLGTDGKFDGTYRAAVCGADGYWWGILGTKQDPNPPIDPGFDPTITGWGSTPDGVFRTFNVHVTPFWDWEMH
jgi:hypothetical protein